MPCCGLISTYRVLGRSVAKKSFVFHSNRNLFDYYFASFRIKWELCAAKVKRNTIFPFFLSFYADRFEVQREKKKKNRFSIVYEAAKAHAYELEHRALELVMKRRCARVRDRCHWRMRVCASAYESAAYISVFFFISSFNRNRPNAKKRERCGVQNVWPKKRKQQKNVFYKRSTERTIDAEKDG